jgi:hypothetical protein
MLCRSALLIMLLLILAGCTGRSVSVPATPEASQTTPQTGFFTTPTLETEATQTPTPSSPPPATIIVAVDDPGTPFDRRILGTNVPAWLNPTGLADPSLRRWITELDPILLRLPGGSWSNYYDWLGCQTGNVEAGSDDGCYWTWAAKPSDFLDLLQSTGQEGMWTVSINGTAQEAAALVAFFNGETDDDHVIGIDRNGRDWKTVADWARLREEAGYPEPYPIKLWEVGNEVYGATPQAGPNCAPWGWEDVWTCDGADYVYGTVQHDGYLAFREAMKSVDPSILVGAVGVEDPSSWSRFGERVIAAAGDQLDFYVVHNYAFDETPTSAESALVRPQEIWPEAIDQIHTAFDRHADGRRVPIAVTEYNLVAVQEQDTQQLMSRAVNALFLADTIGQMALQGIPIANQWNLANGRADNGTDYGLIDIDTKQPYPQYYALRLWNDFGATLLPTASSFDQTRTLSVYAGRTEGGVVTLLVINKTTESITADIVLDTIPTEWQGQTTVVQADSLQAQTILWNGSPPNAQAMPEAVAPFLQTTSITFAPYSITRVHFEPIQ